MSEQVQKPYTPSLLDVFAGDGAFRIESWYPRLEPLTFKTEIFTLEYDEAQALAKYRELQSFVFYQIQEEMIKSDAKKTLVLDSTTVATAREKIQQKLPENLRAALERLTVKLDNAIKPFAESKAGGAFVKTSSRSPKDAAFLTKAMKEILRDGVFKNIKNHPNATDAEALEQDAVAFVRAATQSMKVTNAAEALDLLLSSKRTRDDIAACILQLGEKGFDMKMIVREWVDLDPEWEFRAFIFGGKMTACSQYWTRVFIPKMVQSKEELSQVIYKYWETKVKPILPDLEVYTVDFVVDPNNFENIKLIELNPPPPAAGQALFDWNNKADQHIIINGPFEFRVETTPKEDPLEGIHSASRHLIHLLRGKTDTERQLGNVRCDSCRANPISDSVFYSCRLCGAYDLCPACFKVRKAVKSECDHNDMILQKPKNAAAASTSSSSSASPKNERDSDEEDDRESHKSKPCLVM